MSILRQEGADSTDDLVENGQRLYDERLRALLEPEHDGEFVAIDPDTGHYFLGQTGLAALRAGAGSRELPGKHFYAPARRAAVRLPYVGSWRVKAS